MYQKYHTEALVLGSFESGESDKTLLLYTRDFGLVRARASSIRSEASKMRYALQHYTHAYVSLIKGKRGWRVAGATAILNPGKDRRGVSAFARIAELACRLVDVDEANEYIYLALKDAHHALMQETADAHGMIEIVCVARLLYSLGYISNEALQSALFTHTAYTGESLLEAETMRDTLLVAVNRAIAETQL